MQISMKFDFIPNGWSVIIIVIYNSMLAFIQKMAWRRTGSEPLPEPMID